VLSLTRAAVIREETIEDADGIREVNACAFLRPNEGRLIDRLREDGLIVVSLVATVDRQIIGSAVFSDLPIVTAAGIIEAAALAPIAVKPEHQHRGIGSALVREGLRLCKERGKDAVIVLGDPVYYARFGFSSELAKGIIGRYSGPHWMAIELNEGILRVVEGRVTYSEAFAEVE